MDIFKLFPGILLDILSKVIPGSVFIIAFKGRYLPPDQFLLQVLGLEPGAIPEWKGWFPLVVAIATAYLIGIFIAILAHAVDRQLVKLRWYSYVLSNRDDFSFGGAVPPGLDEALKSNHTFEVYVEGCRTYLAVQNSLMAAMLEKYRTAFRLFVGFTVVLLALPFRPAGAEWTYLFVLSPVSALLAAYLSKRYLAKSIQYYMFAKANAVGSEGENKGSAAQG